MNKLLIHMMNAGDIDHRILPGLQKMQGGGRSKASVPTLTSSTQPKSNLGISTNLKSGTYQPTSKVIAQEILKKQQDIANAEAMAERYGVIRQAEAPRSMASKAWAIATNPMTALKYKVQGRDIPDYFERGEKNSLDLAVNMVNPFAIIESVKNIPGNVARGEFLNAGLNALNILPALSGAKTVGKFVTSAAAPTIRRAAQTAGNQLTRLSKAPSAPVKNSMADLQTSGWGTDKWNLENHVNSIFGPPSQYKPPVINRSGLTKDELLAKAAGKDKDVVSKMSEQDFQETVLKPTGEITSYQQDDLLNKFTGENEIFNMSADEYAEAFNSRLDLLNDIIRRNNKSGIDYTVDKLSPGGKLYFNTPKQFVQNPNKLTEKGAEKLAIFYKNPEEFLTNNAGLSKLDDGYWHFSDDVDLGAYASKDDAISAFKQRLDKEMGPEEIFGKTNWNVDISPGQWRGTVEDVANANYYKRIPGLNITGSSDGVFADRIARRGSGAYNSINEYLKTLDLGRVKPGFNSQSNSSRPLWENAIKKGNAFGYYNNPGTVYGSMKSVMPYVIPGALGAGALSQKKYGGQPCYECGGMYADGGYYDCPDQEKDPVTGKCKAEVVRGKEAAAANKAANADMNAWAKQVAAMDKEIAKQNAAQLAGQLSFDYDWMGSPVDKAEKKAAVAGYKQFFQQNPNTFMPDDTSGYSPEQKYIIASKLKQRMSTPMGSKLVQQQFGIDPRFYDLQRLQTDFAPKMGGWNGMRNWLFNIHKQQGGPIVDPRGQWAHPGKITRIPSSNITMQGVPYPVLGVASSGQQVMMQPGQNYNFGDAEYVDEYPMMQFGGGTLLGPSPMIMSLASKVANYFTKPNSSAGTSKRNISSKERLSSKELFGVSPYDEMQDNYFDKYNDFYNKRAANDTKKYDNSSNSINLSSGRFRGAKVAPAMINDIVNAAKANNVDPWVMLSLVGRESTFGSGTYENTRRAGNKQQLVSGWDVSEEYQPYDVNRYLADKKVPGIRVGKSNHGWEYIVEDEKAIENYLKGNPKLIDDYYKKLESTPDLGKLDSFSLAAQRIKKKGIQNYNPGDPKYPSMINQDMGLLKQDAALKAYMKTLGYKEGGEFGEGLLGRTVSCSNCGWSWKAVDGGSDPMSCHKCGGRAKMQGGGQSSMDSVRHQANKILQYEQLRGGPGGAPLPQYSNPKYMDMLMGKVYPEVKKIMPNASAMEAGEAMDFVFNAGFDQGSNKITKDPRAFALQEYYRQNDPSKLDADGKWAGRKNAPYSFDQEYNNTIGKLPENQRRILMNKGRDWYYKNINNPAPGVPNSNYNDTWYGRIWNTNDYQPFNPNNPNFTPKKEQGGGLLPIAQDGWVTRAANAEFSCAANPRQELRAARSAAKDEIETTSGGRKDPDRDLKNARWNAQGAQWKGQGVTKEDFNNAFNDSSRMGNTFMNPEYAKYFDPANGQVKPEYGSIRNNINPRVKYYAQAPGFPMGQRPTVNNILGLQMSQPGGMEGYRQLVKDEYAGNLSPIIPMKRKGGEASLWDMIKMAQGGEMIRRADGSYSRRGLWDNIRANKGSGKKPTKEMLEQERKIKSKNK